MHRMTLGDFELTVLSDGVYRMDGGAMFGIIPKVMWEKRIQPDERNNIPLALNSLLVRTGEQNILIETGIGNKLSEKSHAIYQNQALLMKSFEEAGVSPEEIDIVINTHLHFDHCGWNTHYKNGKPVATFPARDVLRTGRRAAACPRAARARPRQLYDRQLRSPGEQRADEAVAGRCGDCSWHRGEGLSRDTPAICRRSSFAAEPRWPPIPAT